MSKSKVKSSLSPIMSAMPRCTMELMPEQEVVNSMIVAAEAGEQVEGLANNGFGQVLAHSRKAVVDAGSKVDSYDTAAKIVGGVVDHFKQMVFDEIDARRKGIETGTLVGEDKVDALNDVAKLRARMDNTLKSAKSVITGAIRKGDTVLKIISDGGHILFRKDGTARGKTELQTLVKKAKAYDAPDKSPLEQALAAALLLARRVSDLTNNEDRKTVLDSLKKKIKELDADKDEIEVEEPMAEAA